MERYISLVLLGLVAVALISGTFALLIIGRPVPEPVWVAWGVVITAMFGHGNFLAQNAAHQRVIGDLLDAVQTGAKAANTPTNGGATTTTTSIDFL